MATHEILNNLVNEILKSAERLRGKCKAYEYQSLILPIIVIHRIECVLLQIKKQQDYKKSLIHECKTVKRRIMEHNIWKVV